MFPLNCKLFSPLTWPLVELQVMLLIIYVFTLKKYTHICARPYESLVHPWHKNMISIIAATEYATVLSSILAMFTKPLDSLLDRLGRSSAGQHPKWVRGQRKKAQRMSLQEGPGGALHFLQLSGPEDQPDSSISSKTQKTTRELSVPSWVLASPRKLWLISTTKYTGRR